ncbi:amidohydrolase family protein [Granulicella sp. L60]|uniref:amidohydrolase family protein n=1 Tax=Granulicella sp. L60 TaxID=1641866 RepID=UPI00131C067F|nr:amidohydrolase family protein [Granulicella sp. L60]
MLKHKYLLGFSLYGALLSAHVCFPQQQDPSPPLFPESKDRINGPLRADTMVREHGPKIALEHVTVFDGSGSPPKLDQTVIIDHEKIVAVGPSRYVTPSSDTKVLDETGKTLLPGLIGMHEHLFYPTAGGFRGQIGMYSEQGNSGPMLYLAVGITTARTAGSINPYLDLNLRKAIESGREAGPDLDVTGPYLEGPPAIQIPVHELTGPEDARRTVDYWHEEGATSFKTYLHITPAELQASIDAAHRYGSKITGHLCSIGFTEAAEMGIDNLEHGIIIDTEFYSKKQPGICPEADAWTREMEQSLEIKDPRVQKMIQTLIEHHVAVTSTLDIFEMGISGEPPIDTLKTTHDAMAAASWDTYMKYRDVQVNRKDNPHTERLLRKEMEFEREFVQRGGLLMAGCDPTGFGGILPGFGDQREMELLVQAGFSPSEAVRIYTSNAAKFLGRQNTIGKIAIGMQADLVLLDGDFEHDASVIRKPELVFKKGLGYDSSRLFAAVRGEAGLR